MLPYFPQWPICFQMTSQSLSGSSHTRSPHHVLKGIDIKAVPQNPSILKFAGNFSITIPPHQRYVDHTRWIALLYSRRKVGLSCFRRIMLQCEPYNVLHDRKRARLGTAVERNGLNREVRKKIAKSTVLLEPSLLRWPSNTKGYMKLKY